MNFFGSNAAVTESSATGSSAAHSQPQLNREDSLRRNGFPNDVHDGFLRPNRRPIRLTVDAPSMGPGGRSQPMDVGFSGAQQNGGAFMGGIDGGSTSGAESNGKQVAPSFLFGNNPATKRRSFAMPATAKPVSTGVAAPGILRTREEGSTSSSTKTVTWSPELIREHLITPRKGRDSGSSTAPVMPSVAPAPLDYTFVNRTGPPLRSLRQDIGPPSKLPRIEPELDQPMQGTLSAGYRNGPTQGPDGDYWVTVFGFPSEKFDDVLDLFGRHGNIVSHKKPVDGNWVHLRYSSVVHAQQALARHAKVVGAKLMLGVIPCVDPEVVGDGAVNWVNSSMLSTDSIVSAPSVTVESLNGDVRPPVSVQRRDSLNRSTLSISSRAGMRPLSIAEADISMDTDSPNTSILGKFWNFVTAAPGNP